MIENNRAKILWDFQIETDKMVVADQSDIMVVDKLHKKEVAVDIAIPRDSSSRKKEYTKLEE